MAGVSEINRIIGKYRQFWTREAVKEPILAVRSWILPPEAVDHCFDDEYVVQAYENNYAIRESILDDYIPMLCPDFGSALLAHIAGCDIHFSSGASWNYAFLNDIADHALEYICFDEDRFKILSNRVEYFKKHNKNNYVIASNDMESPFDLAAELLGVQNFCIGFYDDPQRMHSLLDISFDIWYRYVSEMQKIIPKYSGGYFSLWNTWQPDNTIWTTVDTSINLSPKIFEEFFLPVFEKILNKFDWIWLHVHSEALRVVEPLLDEPRIKGFEIADDPTCRTKTIFPKLKEIHQKKTLLLDCKKEDLLLFANNFGPIGLLLFIDGSETPEEANTLLSEVRKVWN